MNEFYLQNKGKFQGYLSPEFCVDETAIKFDSYLAENLTESPEFYLNENGEYAWSAPVPERDNWKATAQEINDTKSHSKLFKKLFSK